MAILLYLCLLCLVAYYPLKSESSRFGQDEEMFVPLEPITELSEGGNGHIDTPDSQRLQAKEE